MAPASTFPGPFFAEFTAKSIRHGSHACVDDLGTTICADLVQHNMRAIPFDWSKTSGDMPGTGRARMASMMVCFTAVELERCALVCRGAR